MKCIECHRSTNLYYHLNIMAKIGIVVIKKNVRENYLDGFVCGWKEINILKHNIFMIL